MLRDLVWVLVALGAAGCGSSSKDDGGPGAPSIGCDDPVARVTATPTITPASVPGGQTTKVDFVIPVTRMTDRVIVSVSQISGASSTAVGITEQAYNTALDCSVTVSADFHEGVAAGQYFPAITLQPAKQDGGSLPTFVDYMYQPALSKKNYTLFGGTPTISDSGIAIPFVVVE